ncbi:MAG TPA: alpha/beta hydrolase [Thermoanaerobaculia bacterium]|nr:alpha/beta hydrolase [Thermoanaerobaculia bacterium]
MKRRADSLHYHSMRKMISVSVAAVLTLACAAPPPESSAPPVVESLDTMSTAEAAPPPSPAPAMPEIETSPRPAPAKSTPPPPRPSARPRPRTSPPPRTAIREVATRDYVKVPVFYATTRKQEQSREPDEMFAGNRARTQHGVSWVSIPRSHEAGELEEPSIFTLTFSEDPAKHVVLLEVKPVPKEQWYTDLNASIADGRLNQAFVFIHGYNVSFEDASRRTAQIKYDLGFAGPAVLFSWPSHGSTSHYLADEANAEWSVPQFADFLVELRRRTGTTTIHLIAHSLGNRVLSRAMERIDLDSSIAPKPAFSQVVLAAPDMDADLFREQLAPRMLKLARGITLYGSNDDRAIIASKKAHQIARAGEGGANLPIVPGIQSIDVTGIDASFLAHSYIGAVSVLGDLAQIFCEGKTSGARFGLKPRNPSGWQMVASEEKRSPRPCLAR